MKTLIVSGGYIDDAFALDYINRYDWDKKIAADRGMEFFFRNGLMPDLIVGDFDSVSLDALEYFRNQNQVEIVTLNPVKDDTDTEYALRKAIGDGATHITLLGTTGSRLDHVLGNIQLLGIGINPDRGKGDSPQFVAGSGSEDAVQIEMVDAHNRIQMISDSLTMRKAEQFGNYVSVIPFTPVVKGVTLEGFKYPLQKVTLESFNTLGISNEIIEDFARVTLEEGILLLVESRD